MADDYDGPWKEAIEEWFPEFIAFFFSSIVALIDWSRGYEFLDTELQQLTPESDIGTRSVDKLVKVFLINGEECWIVVHVEVQSQVDPDFPKRMFRYRYRISDKFDRPVFSLVVLADDSPNWRPSEYIERNDGGELVFRFPTVKLLDFDEARLEEDANAFAPITLAHLKTQATRGNVEARAMWKIRVIRGLYQRGYSAEKVRRLFRVIDWLLSLPPEPAKIVWNEIELIEREKRMPYVTSVELIGIEKGIEKGIGIGTDKGIGLGLRRAIETVLTKRFGAEGKTLFAETQAIHDTDELDRILGGLATADSIDEARKLWTNN